MAVEIILQPATSNLDNNTLYQLAKDIAVEFKDVKVNIVSSIDPHTELQFQLAFDRRRNQWNSPRLLDWFSEKHKRNINTKILVILDVDAYSNGLNYVLGEAFQKGGLGIIYLPRIKQEFYGLKQNDRLFYERMVKECIHELGHVFGFVHCDSPRCVMHFSNSLSDTDMKERSFCRSCRNKLFR
jgi:archaemetzincin